MEIYDVIIIGAGAAGCFAAICLSEGDPHLKVRVLEKTRQPLAKVKISGGGRCNVTHHCFDASKLIENYPRGKDFLRNAFSKFQPQDMIDWLSDHGIELKVEKDGRMFPTTDRSQTIIDCFLSLLQQLNVSLSLESEVVSLSKEDDLFHLDLKNGEKIRSKQVLIATGGLQRSYVLAEGLGHIIEPAIPSLFTFSLQEEWIKAHSGFSAPNAKVRLEGFSYEAQGPILVTHWGVSGPAILKLSAFAARWLFAKDYQAQLIVNWTGLTEQEVLEALFLARKQLSSKKLELSPLFSFSKNFWRGFLSQISPSIPNLTWAQLSKQDIHKVTALLIHSRFTVVGKSLNKDEFVTSGGVSLQEIDPKTFESKKVPGLYFAGEVLNIDGVTGGFNFQSAWTTAFLTAQSMRRFAHSSNA
jgi:predicted Rossmann fold flavoprotein